MSDEFFDTSDDQFRLLSDKAVGYCLWVVFLLAVIFT